MIDFFTTAPQYILPALVLITVVVFFHELGHFWVARRCGVRVDVFSVGFGRELFGFTDRKGTRWKFAAIPLGGYVKMHGQSDTEGLEVADPATVSPQERAQSFLYKPLWQKAAIVAAGPAANYLLAVVVFALLFATLGRPVTPPTIGTVEPGSAAEIGGIQAGDRILSVAGYETEDFGHIGYALQVDVAATVEIVVDRQGQEITLTVRPEVRKIESVFGASLRRIIGVTPSAETEIVRYGPIEATVAAVERTVEATKAIMTAVGQMIAGTRSSQELGGILRIGEMAGNQAKVSLIEFIGFAALISINLGFVNLIPIPLLDGGHLAFYAIEAVRGRPLSQWAQDIALKIGLAAVIGLMLFATWNDLVHFGIVERIIDLVG
jgi:regulator of sigma E protease